MLTAGWGHLAEPVCALSSSQIPGWAPLIGQAKELFNDQLLDRRWGRSEFRWVRQFRSTLSTLKFGLGYLHPALKTKLSMICPKKEILVSVAFLGKELVERAGRH